MKKLLFLLIFAFFALVSANVFGQSTGTSLNPSVGDIWTYKVTSHSGSTYSWTLQDVATGAGTNLFGGTTSTTAIATTGDQASNTVTVTWVNPTANKIYYLHLTETNATCSNRKVLAIQPVNNFKLDIANVDVNGNLLNSGTNSVTYSTCAPAIAPTIAWNGSDPVTSGNATNFNYNYGTTIFYYKITATGINFSNTSWTPDITITQVAGGLASVTVDTQIGGTIGTWAATSILANNATTAPTIAPGTGTNVLWVKVTVNNNIGTPQTANENLVDNTYTIKLNSAKDQNNNSAISLGNISTVQTQLARPDSGFITY